MNFLRRILKRKRRGMTSMAELIPAMIIATMISVVAIKIYYRANTTARSIDVFLQKNGEQADIMQRIAEDIDKIATAGTDATINLENKFSQGRNICRLIIESKYFDDTQRAQVFEKVTWQSRYDVDVNGLVLYRAHSGVLSEDKVIAEFDGQLDEWKDRELFVPVAKGLSFFKIQIPPAEKFEGLDKNKKGTFVKKPASIVRPTEKWIDKKLPVAIEIVLSFASEQKDAAGAYYVEDEDKASRTVVVDRIRKIPYQFIKVEYEIPGSGDGNDIQDTNEIDDINEFNSISVSER